MKRNQAIIIFIVFVLQYLFEHIKPAAQKNNNRKQELLNLAVGALNLGLFYLPSLLVVRVFELVEKHKIGLLQQFEVSMPLNILITIILMDIFMYWWHRFNHTQRIFWKFHRFHHADKRMNTTTALRFHTVELLFSTVFKVIFYFMMGFSFLPILVYEILFFTVVVVHHSNINISRRFDMQYRKIFSSPLMHRIHHSNRQEETDTNYGSVFSWWDKLFKTYKKEAGHEIIFGIAENK